MMNSNVCPRCGKQRVDGKSWYEMSGTSKVKVVMTVCPDPACQKIVDTQYKKDKDERDAQTKARQDSKADRNKNRTNIRL